jgi:hypothetical protein
MSLKNHYASFAIVEIHGEGKVTIESISVSKGECVLSGAWVFSVEETEKINSVISEKLIIPLGEETAVKKLLTDSELKFIKVKPFLQEAKEAANEARAAYETFKSEDAKKRKKMVEPTFFNWPDDLDFNQSSEFLESIGKMAVPAGTPSQMKNTLAAARLLKYLIDMWQEDEQERGNRKYVEGAEAEITILPNSWLRELN